MLRPDENLLETSLTSEKEVLYRDSGEGSKAECSEQHQEETTKREVQCILHSSHEPGIG
jgi:hypothetical protein